MAAGAGFVLIYLLLYTFLRLYAKKIERPLETVLSAVNFTYNAKMDKGLVAFASILGTGILIVLCSGFITALQDYTMIIVAVMFLAAGISATLLCGMSTKELGKQFRTVSPAFFRLF